jgi:hypothetical protein
MDNATLSPLADQVSALITAHKAAEDQMAAAATAHQAAIDKSQEVLTALTAEMNRVPSMADVKALVDQIVAQPKA